MSDDHVSDDGLYDPIVIDPLAHDNDEAWKECQDYVEQCGGVSDRDGNVNWRAAFGADPGVCSCPACGRNHWAFGNRQRCTRCDFEYPTDWWPMYSYGVSAAKMHIPADQYPFTAGLHGERMAHPYYRYGYGHPVDDAWREHAQINWKVVLNA